MVRRYQARRKSGVILPRTTTVCTAEVDFCWPELWPIPVPELAFFYAKVKQTCHGHLLVVTQTQIAVCQENRGKSFACKVKIASAKPRRPLDMIHDSYKRYPCCPEETCSTIGLSRTTKSFRQ